MRHLIVTPSQLSHALRSARKARGLSQDDAGKLVGLLPKTISALENRPGSASIDSLFKLMSALDLEVTIAAKETNARTGDAPSSAGEEW